MCSGIFFIDYCRITGVTNRWKSRSWSHSSSNRPFTILEIIQLVPVSFIFLSAVEQTFSNLFLPAFIVSHNTKDQSEFTSHHSLTVSAVFLASCDIVSECCHPLNDAPPPAHPTPNQHKIDPPPHSQLFDCILLIFDHVSSDSSSHLATCHSFLKTERKLPFSSERLLTASINIDFVIWACTHKR